VCNEWKVELSSLEAGDRERLDVSALESSGLVAIIIYPALTKAVPI